MMNFTVSLIRELRGSPITILLAFIVLEHAGTRPITAKLLKDATGYKDNTITDGLRLLEDPTHQIISRVKNGWVLSTGFQQPLEIRDIRELPPIVNDVVVIEDTEGQSNNNNSIKPNNRDIRECLVEAGIYEPMTSKLAALPWVTVEFIQKHKKVIDEEQWENPTGMLIFRLRNNHPPKQTKEERIRAKFGL